MRLAERDSAIQLAEKESQEQLQYLEGRLLSARQQQQKEATQMNTQVLAAQEHRERLQDMVMQKQQQLKAQEDKLQQYEEARNKELEPKKLFVYLKIVISCIDLDSITAVIACQP